jgi:hypothetical protein
MRPEKEKLRQRFKTLTQRSLSIDRQTYDPV